ncbi:hypothetical protein SDC9_150099 [bioreactor metagenome]|uniref:Uncharacterized protein n=1 Tax=bioreactor metagenome TaxID=1076179 RepID=A0A645ELI5_9ZZZZ
MVPDAVFPGQILNVKHQGGHDADKQTDGCGHMQEAQRGNQNNHGCEGEYKVRTGTAVIHSGYICAAQALPAHSLLLGVADKPYAERDFQRDLDDDDDEAGGRRDKGAGSERLHRHQQLHGGRAGRPSGEGAGAGKVQTRSQGAGDICLLKQRKHQRIEGEHAYENRNAAVAHDAAGHDDGGHDELVSKLVHDEVGDGLSGSGDLNNLAEDGAQNKDEEVALNIVGEGGDIGDCHALYRVHAGGKEDKEAGDDSAVKHGYALNGQYRKKSQRDQKEQDIHNQTPAFLHVAQNWDPLILQR